MQDVYCIIVKISQFIQWSLGQQNLSVSCMVRNERVTTVHVPLEKLNLFNEEKYKTCSELNKPMLFVSSSNFLRHFTFSVMFLSLLFITFSFLWVDLHIYTCSCWIWIEYEIQSNTRIVHFRHFLSLFSLLFYSFFSHIHRSIQNCF